MYVGYRSPIWTVATTAVCLDPSVREKNAHFWRRWLLQTRKSRSRQSAFRLPSSTPVKSCSWHSATCPLRLLQSDRASTGVGQQLSIDLSGRCGHQSAWQVCRGFCRNPEVVDNGQPPIDLNRPPSQSPTHEPRQVQTTRRRPRRGLHASMDGRGHA